MPIDPMAMLMSAISNNVNPLSVMQQYIGDPRIGQAVKMIQGKSPAQLKQMAQNMAKERGTTAEQIAQSLGLNIPR